MNPDRACDHPDFTAQVDVNRLTEREGGRVDYAADIKVWCAACGEPFRWTGLPGGVNRRRPTCSADQTELRAPLRPASTDPDWGLASATLPPSP